MTRSPGETPGSRVLRIETATTSADALIGATALSIGQPVLANDRRFDRIDEPEVLSSVRALGTAWSIPVADGTVFEPVFSTVVRP